jgi:hypothetical protein
MNVITFSGLGSHGELGNQLFQVAAVLGYAANHDKNPIFPVWKCNLSSRDYTEIFKNPVNQKFDYYTPFHHRYTYMELKYKEIPVIGGNVDFVGYFQSENYFKHIEQEIKNTFQPNDEIKKYIEDKYSSIISTPDKVSLHVRSGSRSRLDHDVHAYVTTEYITEALKDFTDKKMVVVIADNMERAREILPPDDRYVFIEGEENYIDLFLMTYFDSYIVSPSTFGWWGAWLSQSANPKVVIMKDWFAKDKSKAYLNNNDIVPDRWKKI